MIRLRRYNLVTRSNMDNPRRIQAILLVAVAGTLAACSTTSPSGGFRAVQPGAPGETSRVLDANELGADTVEYTDADVHFMSGMIAHHAQALEMTSLIEQRTDRENLRLLGMRISVSQRDEIRLMQNWLKRHGEEIPDGTTHHMMMGDEELMPGMLNMEQMHKLEQSEGEAFYRLWLEYMVMHHEGALTMVETLLASEGAAQDSEIFRFAADVDADQRMEITRMKEMLQGLR